MNQPDSRISYKKGIHKFDSDKKITDIVERTSGNMIYGGMDSLKFMKMDSLVAPVPQNTLRRMSVNSASIASTYKKMREHEKEGERPSSPPISQYGGLSQRSQYKPSIEINKMTRFVSDQSDEKEDLGGTVRLEGGRPKEMVSKMQRFVFSGWFNFIIMILIGGNTFVMSLDRYPITK